MGACEMGGVEKGCENYQNGVRVSVHRGGAIPEKAKRK